MLGYHSHNITANGKEFILYPHHLVSYQVIYIFQMVCDQIEYCHDDITEEK